MKLDRLTSINTYEEIEILYVRETKRAEGERERENFNTFDESAQNIKPITPNVTYKQTQSSEFIEENRWL